MTAVAGGAALRVATLADPVARALVHRQWAELSVRYDEPTPCGEDDSMPTGSFIEPDGVFLLVEADGVAVGCGGLRPVQEPGPPGTAEIKRMFTIPERRSRGLGRLLLDGLEAHARRLGYERVWLETGTAQPEAIALYERAGYQAISPYGEYRDSPESRCYSKVLGRPSRPGVAMQRPLWLGGGTPPEEV